MKSTFSTNRIHIFLALALALAIMIVPLYTGLTAPADHDQAPSSGIVCTTNPTSSFTLTAKDGFASMTDGNKVYMWSYAEGLDDFQYPGPALCVNEGDTVTVVLHNSLAEPVSITFPGQENVLADGQPAQPVYQAGELASLTPAAQPGGTVTYEFTATHPGTFVYQSGTNPAIQVQMGLYGALIVRPALDQANPGRRFTYNHLATEFNPDAEILMLLSEIDPLLHQAIERGEPFDLSTYHPRYFLINGRTFPDTIAPNNASWLPNQPYGSLAHIHPYDPVDNPLPALTRYIGVGSDDFPFHPHAYNGRVIARDAQLLRGPADEDLSYEGFSHIIGPGQTWDIIFTWEDEYGFDASGNPLPITIPNDQNIEFGPFYSGSGYLGNADILPVGVTSYNQCGEFYHIAHNHALQQLVGWGVVMTGQTTFTRIDPPLPNNCPTE